MLEVVSEILGVAAIVFIFAYSATGVHINRNHKSPFASNQAKLVLAIVCIAVSIVGKALALLL